MKVKKLYSIEVKGNHKTWSFNVWDYPEHAEDWRRDGLEVGEILNTIPTWVIDMGLTKIWIRVQDFLNFRWRK